MPSYEFILTGRLIEAILQEGDPEGVRADLGQFIETAAREYEKAGAGEFALTVKLSGYLEGDECETPARVYALQGALQAISSAPVERVFRKVREPRKARATP